MATTIDQSVDESRDVGDEEGLVLQTNLSDCPPELLRLLCLHLHAGDSVIFRRLICKSIELAVATINLSPKTNPHPQLPCLVSFDDNVFKLHSPIHTGVQEETPDLSDARIRHSKFGWLLMSGGDCGVFFFNPFTKVIIKLPNLPPDISFPSMCFNAPPNSPDCIVIGVGQCGTFFGTIRRGEKSWTLRLFKKQFSISAANPLICNGMCYCLGYYGNLGVFDPCDDKVEISWTVLGKSYSQDLFDSVHQGFLVERNRREILRVLVLQENKKILISRFNLTKKIWGTPLTSLGNQMLFLSREGTFLQTTDDCVRGMGNKVYLPKVRDNICLFYSLSATKYLSFYSDYSCANCLDVEDLSYTSAWIEPRFCNVEPFEW